MVGGRGVPALLAAGGVGAKEAGEQRLLSGHTYTFVFHDQTDDYANGAVTFTTADLGRLKRGQVWADDRAMSVEEFEKVAEESC